MDLYERRDTSNDANLQLTHPLLNLTQDLPRGKVFDVFITNVNQGGEFFVVKKANEHILVDIANKLQQLAESRRLKPLGSMQLGQICVARFPVELGGDGLYYRAEVLTVASGMVVVRYLDYGNQEFINVNEHVLSFPSELNTIPAQAIKCVLALSRSLFDKYKMYGVLSEYVDRCNQGEHFGIEIRELPEQPRQPAKVSFRI